MKHLKENNVTYLEHFRFAFKIGLTLVFRGNMFILHAFLPFIGIPRKWNLEQTATDLRIQNQEAWERK